MGSEQESDKVPIWQGFQILVLPTVIDGISFRGYWPRSVRGPTETEALLTQTPHPRRRDLQPYLLSSMKVEGLSRAMTRFPRSQDLSRLPAAASGTHRSQSMPELSDQQTLAVCLALAPPETQDSLETPLWATWRPSALPPHPEPASHGNPIKPGGLPDSCADPEDD